MKKVLFTATVDSHILQFHLPFLKLFKEKGYEVHVATNGNEKIPYCDIKHIVSFERTPLKLNNLKAVKQLRKIINKEEFDIIHTHTPMGSVVTRLAAVKARRKYHTRVIYTAHGLHFFKGAPLKNWLMFYPIEKYLSKYTDTLILINQEDYNLCKRKFKKCKDIQYVPGVGIDEEKFNFKMSRKEKKELRESLGIKENNFVIIYPAELNWNKNQLMIIKVIEKLSKKYNNLKVLLPGVDSYNGYYQKIVKEKGIEDSIKFLGYRKDIPKLLKIADLAVATSHREGLPLNVMEAMYVGLPIIATDCRGQRDLIKEHVNGYLVGINDQDKFYECIEKIYLSKNENSKFGEESQYVIKEYLLDKILDKLKNIYFKKKRVIHVLASSKYSGAENVACTIIDNLKDEYDMYYCCTKGAIEKILIEKNIKYIPIDNLSIREIRRVVKDNKPDIIHAHDNRATVISSRFNNKCKIISHIHGNNKIMNSINLKTLVFNYCSKKIKKIIWVSASSFDGYVFKNNVEDKSVILYNVIDIKELERKSKLYNCDKNFDLIFLGRIAYPKNPERLIEIMKLLKEKKKDISLAIVGDGVDRKKVEDLIKKYNLEYNITMYGFKNNPYPILLNSKILIMTSIYEGTPMCALEAQALGKPIVATPVDGLKNIISNDFNGYLLNDNNLFVENIINILQNDLKIEKLSVNSKISFEKNNDLHNYIDKIDDIYN